MCCAVLTRDAWLVALAGGFFETDSWLLENVNKIKDIPCVIVQV